MSTQACIKGLPELILTFFQRKLDEGQRFGWDFLSTAHPLNDLVPPDVWRTPLWLLLHHAGFVTYPHHDANGLMTYVIPEDGWKFWAIMAPKEITGMETREQLVSLFEDSMDFANYQTKTDIHIIFARPGDLL